jgi:GT2 family glycosyltransferase
MSERITIVIPVRERVELTRACLESLERTREPFQLLVADSGSTDATAELLAHAPLPPRVRHERIAPGTSLATALNRVWPLVRTEVVCFIHNDTEMVEPAWLSRLCAALEEPAAGLAGLYGAKRIRRDGRYVGRTIVHSLAEGPTVEPPWEDVAVVDAVCLCLRRDLLATIGGFDEGYDFHCLDRELSFAVRERGRRCLVAHAPFLHRGGGTRTSGFDDDRDRERADLERRRAALERFTTRWAHRLPADVRPLGRRLTAWVSARTAGRPTDGRAAIGAPGRRRR